MSLHSSEALKDLKADVATQIKTAGNTALKKGKTEEASTRYSEAIRVDGSNHVFWSNRR
jgi:hypothetical protein